MQIPDAHTRLVTLLGYPIEHSLSPLIHNSAFNHQGANFVYTASPVRPDALQEAVEGLKALGAAGANVTIPYKQDIREHVDEITPAAQAVGAVNTLVRMSELDEPGIIRGDNTDVEGFLQPLEPYADRLRRKRALIFGSGGAARAVVYALLTEVQPERLTIAARSPGKAEQLASDFEAVDDHKALEVRELTAAGERVRTSDLLVNATPVGMHPTPEKAIWSNREDYHSGQVAYDLVYRPRRTKWLQLVAEEGGETIDGLEMLLQQAAASYRQWTNRKMPLREVRPILHQAVVNS